MSQVVKISGHIAPGFDAVADALAENFANGEELGARFTAYRDGAPIVDIWAGHVDRAAQTPWTDDTLTCLFSTGKAVMSFLMARAVSQGLLDYAAPVAAYWPEFAANGKAEITVAQALSHQAGLCGFPDEIPSEEWVNWDAICARLAAMAPLWPPGTASGYHPQTVGFIAGELLRRVSGMTIGETLRRDFAGFDVHCGLTGDEMARTAYMPKPPRPPVHRENSEFTKIAFLKPWSATRVPREQWMAAEIPGSNMHATARAVAGILHPLANDGVDMDGARQLGPDVIEQALRVRVTGEDLVLPFNLAVAAGLMANRQGHFGPSPSAYGHAGFGGSCAVVDPDAGVSAAYVMNKMSPSLIGDARALRLLDALFACL
ncbi:MAG: serine hydrolase domain-containing protein [Parvularculaceae bacterium]|nr:beta-lactamase family protein [Parvularculaceae bacterium]